jgi:hypothetical protein
LIRREFGIPFRLDAQFGNAIAILRSPKPKFFGRLLASIDAATG